LKVRLVWGQPPTAVQPSEARQLPVWRGRPRPRRFIPDMYARASPRGTQQLSSRAKRNGPRGSFRAVEGLAFPCRPSPAPGFRRGLFPLRLLIYTLCHPGGSAVLRSRRTPNEGSLHLLWLPRSAKPGSGSYQGTTSAVQVPDTFAYFAKG